MNNLFKKKLLYSPFGSPAPRTKGAAAKPAKKMNMLFQTPHNSMVTLL